MSRLLFALLFALTATAATPVRAQDAVPLRATVIVSDLGPAAPRGRQERRLAEAWAERRERAGGVFGTPVELRVTSDASDPSRAARLASEAIDDGAHAIVCCSTAGATRRVAEVAATAGVPLLALTVPTGDVGTGWAFVLPPSDRVQLQAAVRDAYGRGITGLGLMAPEGALGDATEESLRQLIAVETMRVIATARYPMDAEVLTPEALQVATREPGAILAWGLRDDTARAVDGLRARGWSGPVYVRTSLLDPLAGGLPPEVRGDVRVAVPPVLVAVADPREGPTARHGDAVLEVRRLAGEGRPGVESALVHDALALLTMGFERASVYGVSPDEVARYRLALRDALVSVGPVPLAAGTYDPEVGRTDAATAEGLIMATRTPGGLEPLP